MRPCARDLGEGGQPFPGGQSPRFPPPALPGLTGNTGARHRCLRGPACFYQADVLGKGVFPDLSPALQSCTITPRVGPEGARTSRYTHLPPQLHRPEPALCFQSGPCNPSCPWAPPWPPTHLPLEPGPPCWLHAVFRSRPLPGTFSQMLCWASWPPSSSPSAPGCSGCCSSCRPVTPTAQPETEPPSPKTCVDRGVGHIARPLPL